jgi:hypothetical protein
MLALNILPFPLSGTEREMRERIKAGQVEKAELDAYVRWQDEINTQIIAAACVNPTLWLGNPAETPSGAAHYSDLTDDDVLVLVTEISRLSGWMREGDAAKLEPFPPGSAGGEAGSAGA